MVRAWERDWKSGHLGSSPRASAWCWALPRPMQEKAASWRHLLTLFLPHISISHGRRRTWTTVPCAGSSG